MGEDWGWMKLELEMVWSFDTNDVRLPGKKRARKHNFRGGRQLGIRMEVNKDRGFATQSSPAQ